jgi:FkbM family methyltransferase
MDASQEPERPYAALPDCRLLLTQTRYGRMYALAGDSVIGRSLALYGEWAQQEIDTLATVLVDGKTIVDIGANVGTHALALAKRFPNSQIVAIEPQPIPFALLTANALMNGCDNIRSYNAACGANVRVERVSFDYDVLDGNAGAFSIAHARTSSGYPLVVMPLDSIAVEGSVQLLKIDVEGMESEVLAGARATIGRHRPAIFYEVRKLEKAAACRELLRELQYDQFWLETLPFNADNYKKSDENIWYSCEYGILAIPSELGKVLPLPRVTGEETSLPHSFDPRAGYSGQERV